MSVITHLLTLTWLITARPDRDSDWDSKLGSRGRPQGLRLGWRWRAGQGGGGGVEGLIVIGTFGRGLGLSRDHIKEDQRERGVTPPLLGAMK